MLQNYLKITFRSLLRHRTYTALNVGGMGIGLATGLLLLFWVQHEISFDTFHENAPNLYRVNANVEGFDVWENTPQPLATFARHNLPEVALAARVKEMRRIELFKIGEKRFFEKNYGVVDSTFFLAFGFKMVAGDATKPFQDAKSIVLSERAAQRFFGPENPIGKTLEYKGMALNVSGVMADFPENSSYRFDFVLNNSIFHQRCLENPTSCYRMPEENWGNYDFHTWLLLQPGANLEAVGEKCTEALYRNHSDLEEGKIRFSLQPLSTLHLYEANGSPGQIKLVKTFFAIAVLILLLAAMNYVNLATAQATQRVKEVSVRKIIGAERWQLFGQFWTETAVLLTGSLVVALLLIEAAAPFYKALAGKTFGISLLDAGLWKVIGLTFTIVWAMTAIYPALLLSSFRPALALKGAWLPGGKAGSLRKGLIVMQFAVSAGLLICAFVMRRQLLFMQEKDLGFDVEQVLEFPIWDFTKKYDFVKAEVEKMPGALAVTAYNGGVFTGWNSTTDLDWDGKPAGLEFVINQLGVAPNFLDFFEIPLVEGQAFDLNLTGQNQILLNETAVNKMGLKSPVSGQSIRFHNEPATIIGVTKDVHMASMKEAIGPNIYCIDPEYLGTVYVKTTASQAQDLVAAIGNFWKANQPDFPFNYEFLDQRYAQLYEKDMQARKLFEAFSLVALLISCLGLFGLAMHAAKRRTKEIGIRKVLGASVLSVAGLL
ncbi:MAG: ABC transporter permease, partial [Phaeodactylibacter sp.]|nr:ABC transporter permease [Phaeodactylibacter sp.]